MRVRTRFSVIRTVATSALLAVLLLPAALVWAHDHTTIPNRERVEPTVGISIGVSKAAELPVSLTVGPAELGAKSGFGVKVFVDGVQLYVNETVLSTSHSFALDLKKLGVGYHYVLANVCDHHDHIGVAAVWIQITKDLRVIRYSDAPPELVKLWLEGVNDWPGKLTAAVAPTDPTSEDTYLNCCGDYSPWPTGANDTDSFTMHRY